MVDETTQIKSIGDCVCNTVNQDMLKKSEGNYSLSDYINDFEGTQYELDIALIKYAANIL